MENKKFDVVIIGAGPAGIFTALKLNDIRPDLKVLIVDMGRDIASRVCPARKTGVCAHCKPCAIVSGWAGAGAFSDGKLSLSDEVGGHLNEYVGHEKAMQLIEEADQYYLKFGADETIEGLDEKKIDEIAYEASKYNIKLIRCPIRHLGTERAYDVLSGMYDELIKNPNFTFLPMTEAEDILIEDNKVVGVTLKPFNKEVFTVTCSQIVAAPGRGGAEWLEKTVKKLNLETMNNEVDIGVRVEVPNSVMDNVTKALYEAKMVYYGDTYENKVRTFCMNPGGVVSEEHYENGLAVVNGHSYGDKSKWTENTNFAILASTRFTQPFNQPIEYGQYVAKLANMLTGGPIMVQRLGDLLKGRRTTKERLAKSTTIPTLKTAVPGDLSFVLPPRHLTTIIESLKAFDHLCPGLYSKNTLLYGVEVKFYSSKVKVDEKLMTKVDGLYTIGDGAGVTRGLMQASATGIYVAETISKKL